VEDQTVPDSSETDLAARAKFLDTMTAGMQHLQAELEREVRWQRRVTRFMWLAVAVNVFFACLSGWSWATH
jgi:hypothetical protein